MKSATLSASSAATTPSWSRLSSKTRASPVRSRCQLPTVPLFPCARPSPRKLHSQRTSQAASPGSSRKKDSSSAFLVDLLDVGSKGQLDEYVWGRDVLDILGGVHRRQVLARGIRQGSPQASAAASYSIASPSQRVVGRGPSISPWPCVRFQPTRSSHLHRGVCSTFLAERAGGPGGVPVFTHTAKHFRVPEKPRRRP